MLQWLLRVVAAGSPSKKQRLQSFITCVMVWKTWESKWMQRYVSYESTMPRLGIGFNTIKRSVKGIAGKMAALTVPFVSQSNRAEACVFVYHRLAQIEYVDPYVDDWNVSPATFERQMADLAKFVEFVRLSDLPGRLRDVSRAEKPLVSVTFDDGYASVYTHALPILKKFNIPATVFVVTAFVDRQDPMPFDRWASKQVTLPSAEMWRAMTWTELEACAESGLVTIASHSHEHLDGRKCSEAQMQEEAERSHDILQGRFGDEHSHLYSYPYGSTRLGNVPPAYVDAVKRAGYEIAVCTDLGLVDNDSDPFVLPRIEAHALDSAAVMRAKVFGALLPYRLTDALRMAKRHEVNGHETD